MAEGNHCRKWAGYATLVENVRTMILSDVLPVPVPGTPGTCLVTKERSVAILNGSKPQNVIMAAGGFGNGRVFAFTHDGYLKDAEFKNSMSGKKLLKNVYNWVSNGAFKKENDDVIELKNNSTNFKGKKVVVWCGGPISKELADKVRVFIEKGGGGLVHAMTPWGWLQLNPGKKLEDMPLTDILAGAGIYYTSDCAETSKGQLKVDVSADGNQQAMCQNMCYALATQIAAVDKEPNAASAVQDFSVVAEQIVQGMSAAPPEVRRELAHDARTLLLDHTTTTAPDLLTPSCAKPIRDPAQRCLTMLRDQLCNLDDQEDEEFRCVTYCEDYLGRCGEGEVIVGAEREFNTKLKNFHSTGLYARPGDDISVEVVSDGSTLKDSWIFRIGSHTDDLSKLDHWCRWPKLVKRQALDKSAFKIRSPYGGLIYLENPQDFDEPRGIRIRIDGALEAPQFNITSENGKDEWLKSREAPGPWADMNGRHISFTLPARAVKHIDDPTPCLEVWDKVVEAHCDLRGTDVADFPHQWVVCDAQPVAGYMHAGYPIVTMMDVADHGTPDLFLLNPDRIWGTGCWGMFHEIGHNFQRPWWTFRGTGEVTCNIFTLHAMDVVSNRKPWIHEWLSNQLERIQKTLQKDDPYADWVEDPGVGLGIYAQLQNCFGWDAYKSVFRHYEALKPDLRPQGDDAQIEYWVRIFSQTVRHNLCPLFEFWGFRLGEDLVKELNSSGLPPFLPDDEMTQMAEHRVKVIEEVYPGLLRSVGEK